MDPRPKKSKHITNIANLTNTVAASLGFSVSVSLTAYMSTLLRWKAHYEQHRPQPQPALTQRASEPAETDEQLARRLQDEYMKEDAAARAKQGQGRQGPRDAAVGARAGPAASDNPFAAVANSNPFAATANHGAPATFDRQPSRQQPPAQSRAQPRAQQPPGQQVLSPSERLSQRMAEKNAAEKQNQQARVQAQGQAQGQRQQMPAAAASPSERLEQQMRAMAAQGARTTEPPSPPSPQLRKVPGADGEEQRARARAQEQEEARRAQRAMQQPNEYQSQMAQAQPPPPPSPQAQAFEPYQQQEEYGNCVDL